MKLYLILPIIFIFNVASATPYDSVSTRVDIDFVNGLTLEEGVTAAVVVEQGKKLLNVGTIAAPKRGPAAYLATVAVKPGVQYTYFVTGYRRSACRVLLYVTSATGNVLWPGADVKEGVSRSVFTVPADVNQVSLAVSFLYPEEPGNVLIEDIALVEGDVAVSPTGLETSFGALLESPRNWTIWVYGIAVAVLTVILFFTTSNINSSRKISETEH